MSAAAKVVFDCNVFLQAASNPGGPAGQCFAAVESGLATLFVSAALLEELRDVLARPKVQTKLRISDRQVEAFLDALIAIAILIDVVPEVWTYDRDPKDALYVNLALAVDARLVVTRDLDLLDLMDDSNADGRKLRGDYPDFSVLTPSQFLGRLAGN